MSGSEERWNDEATGAVMSQCYYCRRRGPEGQVCEAYPAGIPDEFLRNTADHRVPQPGDRGVTFAPRDAVTPEELARLARVLDRRGAPGAGG